MLAIAAAKLGWGPIHAYDHELPALEAAAANAAANGVEVELVRVNLRERLPELAPTVVANMTAPILRAVAARLAADGESRGGSARSSNSGEAPTPSFHLLPARSSAPGSFPGVG